MATTFIDGACMSDALILGTLFGVVIGLIHARSVYTVRAREASDGAVPKQAMARGRAVYFALWTFALWLVFGFYVFYLWVASIVIYGIYCLLWRRMPVQTD